jgi:hypothetical protein
MKHSIIVFIISAAACLSTEAVGVVTLGQVQLEPSKAQDAFAAIAVASATVILQESVRKKSE